MNSIIEYKMEETLMVVFQDVLCHYDYAERVGAKFVHKVQSEYYGGNRSVLPNSDINSTMPSHQHHDDIKQDAATTTSHTKRLIALLKQ